MMSYVTIDRKNLPDLNVIFSISMIVVVSWLVPIMLIPKVIQVANKAAVTVGGQFNVIMTFVAIVIYPVWILSAFKAKPINAFGIYLLFLPLTFRMQRVFSIVAYQGPGSNYAQEISGTTFLLIFLFLVFIFRKVPMRKSAAEFLLVEKLFIWFAIVATISQLLTHDLYHGLLVSLGGVWQFVFVFYIVMGVLQAKEDAIILVHFLVGAILVGIFFRMGSFKEFFFVTELGRYQRLGGGAFGGAASYGGYLSLAFILCLFLIQGSKSRIAKGFSIFSLILLSIELLNTFTRGAFISLIVLFLLPFWKSQQKLSLKLSVIIAILTPFLGKQIWYLISYRGFYLDQRFFQIPSVANRIELIGLGIRKVLHNYGFGYGMGNTVLFSTSRGGSRLFAIDNFTLQSSYEVGLIATVIFYVIIFYILRALLKNRQGKSIGSNNSLQIFLFLAILSWFIFANTTSTSLFYYFPYEAGILFYTVLFISVFAICDKSKEVSTLILK